MGEVNKKMNLQWEGIHKPWATTEVQYFVGLSSPRKMLILVNIIKLRMGKIIEQRQSLRSI